MKDLGLSEGLFRSALLPSNVYGVGRCGALGLLEEFVVRSYLMSYAEITYKSWRGQGTWTPLPRQSYDSRQFRRSSDS